MLFGTGIIHSKSSKQKINTKSTNEAEIVEVRKYLPHNIRAEMCMGEMGYKLTKNKLYQDSNREET